MIKRKIGGRWVRVKRVNDATGYFDRNDAGDRPEFKPKDWGDDVGFVGSPTEEYTFKDPIHGTHTITAESYEDALRIAESMGYRENDYQPRKKNRGGKKR